MLTAFILGLIEGLTEFLPISSTGHLLIAQHWLGRRSDFFNIAIQAGAILAVTLVFRQRLLSFRQVFSDLAVRDYVFKLGLAFATTAVVGIPVRLMGWELPESLTPIAWALVIGGVLMLLIEQRARVESAVVAISWQVAVWVGIAQVIAGIFPGTSRSAAAIFAALLAGLGNRAKAAEFVFLLGIPTMFAATGFAALEWWLNPSAPAESFPELAVAFLASVLAGFVSVRWLMQFLQSHRFTVFAIYRIIFGAAILLAALCGYL